MPRKKKESPTPEIRKEAETQIKEMQRKVDYDLRDFTIEFLIQQFREGEFYIPPYQREFVWNAARRHNFIESVILGLPIPFMFVADTDDGRLEIVDGAQRIQSLEAFLNDDLILEKLEKLTSLNGFRFSDLPSSQQRKFKNRALRMIVLEDKTTPEIRHEIFKRINTSAMRAKGAEIRKGAFAGPFMTFVGELAKNPLFIQLCPIGEVLRMRQEPQELVIRFLAYSDKYKSFKHDVDPFLMEYVKEHYDNFDKKRLKEEFDRMLRFVERHFPFGFAKSDNARSTPRVRFEAIAVGVNLALRKKPNLVPGSMKWLESDEFKEHTTTHASNSAPRLQGRIEFVRDKLLAGAK